MSIAVHIDGRRMASLRRQRNRLVGRKAPATYIALPAADAERGLLERARIPYATCDGATIVVGRHAEDLAPLLHVPRLPVLPEGRLPEDDPLGRQLAAAVFDSLLPRPAHPGETCALALPLVLEQPLEATPEWHFFSRLARLKGYEPVPVDVREATALAELSHTGFTGLTLIIDSTASTLALTHCTRVLVEATIPSGGGWIDEHFARKMECIVWDMDGTSYVDIDAIDRWKRAQAPNLHAPQNDEVQLLSYIYEQLLQDLFAAFREACRKTPVLETLRGPFSLVCAGMPTTPAGFPQLAAAQLRRANLPLQIAEIRVAEHPHYTIPRGELIHTEVLAEPLRRSA